jgi:hypothetical protein
MFDGILICVPGVIDKDASLSITPGTQMRIPTNLSNILSDLEKINK